jgi:hypothetical protein
MTHRIDHASNSRRQPGRLLFILALTAVAGCQTIPDVAPWNQATKDVTGAVVTSFQSAANVNADIGRRLAESEISKSPADRYAHAAGVLNKRTNDYEKLFGAIADYSGSLAAIAKAADNSQKAVDAVAGSVNHLVTAIGGTALAGAGFELAKTLFNEAIKIKAAGDFGDAVQKADPVMAQIADLLVKDLADLQRTVGPSKDLSIRVAIENPLRKSLDYRAALERRWVELQEMVRNAVSPGANADGTFPPTKSLVNVSEASELAKVDQLLREADAWYKPMQEELQSRLAGRAKTEELAIQAGRAVQAWRESHASLAEAIKERRPPESARLAALAVRIRDLADDLKKGK